MTTSVITIKTDTPMKNKIKPELPILEHKGYRGLLRWNEHDNNRIYGEICTPEDPDTPLENWGFAQDSIEDAEKFFKSQVERIIANRTYNKDLIEWRKVTDYESVRSVMDIVPDKFKQRVKDGLFDKSLLYGVKGGCYAVPLYYVTKAWETILKGSLEPIDHYIGPEEEDDCTDESIAEFLSEINGTRSRCEACRDNDRMKALWKELFDIDIDVLDVDFHRFDKHLPPNVSMKEYEDYFDNVPYGINEWILGSVNYPENESIFHDSVASLMEFTAQVLLWREDKLIYY